MSKRTTVTLPDAIFAELEDWATQQGRPTANLAAVLIELSLKQAKDKNEFQPSQRSAIGPTR